MNSKTIILLLLGLTAVFSFQQAQLSMDITDFNLDYFVDAFEETESEDEPVEVEEYTAYVERLQNTPYFMKDYDQYDHSDDFVQPYDEGMGKMFAAFTQAAYCKSSKIRKWKCGRPCKDYKDMSDVIVITNQTLKNNKAYVGYYSPLNMIVISWKGTISIRNWLEDFDFFKTKYPFCEGCEVHEGFFKAYNSMQDQFWDAYDQLREKYPTAQIGLTGHSLGAALSTMNAADLIEHGINNFVWYNFGSPRVGNEAFSTWLQGQYTQRLYRVTHHQDPVPHLPPMDWGFHHLAIEVFYVNSSKPSKEHIICNETGEDPNCSDKYLLDLNVVDHVQYEGYQYVINIAKCLI